MAAVDKMELQNNKIIMLILRMALTHQLLAQEKTLVQQKQGKGQLWMIGLLGTHIVAVDKVGVAAGDIHQLVDSTVGVAAGHGLGLQHKQDTVPQM